MGTLIAMHGLPRSGKSTIAREFSKRMGAPIVNRDAIRLALHGQVYAGEAEDFTRAIYKIMIRALFLAGHDVVIADETHWSRAARDHVKDTTWKTIWVSVMTDAGTCKQRAIDTNQLWLLDVINEMSDRHEPLGDDEPLANYTVGGKNEQA